MRFLYMYVMSDDPGRVRRVAPHHAAYWQRLGLNDYEGGPFADRSGGLIVFTIDSAAEAQELVANDPFVKESLIESHWLEEWIPESAPTR